MGIQHHYLRGCTRHELARRINHRPPRSIRVRTAARSRCRYPSAISLPYSNPAPAWPLILLALHLLLRNLHVVLSVCKPAFWLSVLPLWPWLLPLIPSLPILVWLCWFLASAFAICVNLIPTFIWNPGSLIWDPFINQFPGRCWRPLLHGKFLTAPSSSLPSGVDPVTDINWPQLINGWAPHSWLRPMLQHAGVRHVHITPLSPRAWHIGLRPGSRRVAVSRLPPGYYGMAHMDHTFFADSPLHVAALSLHMGDYARSLHAAHSAVPFDVAPSQRQWLRHAGLPDPAPGALSHPHPVHYALERRSLSLVARVLARSDWFALFLSPHKVSYMGETPGCADPVGYFNPRYVAKDVARYRGTSVPGDAQPFSSAPVWFAHDTLHHLTPSVVGSWFDANPTLQYLVATLVVPPETLWDLPALSPSLYNFERRGDKLVYVPEGDNGGAYVQQYAARDWLSADRLITPGSECLHVGLLSTNAAHHVLLISRPQVLSDEFRVFDMPDLVEIPFIAHPFGSKYSRLTYPALVAALSAYATRVNATGIRDLYAKVASHQAEVYGRYPASMVRAAILYVGRQRALDYHAAAGPLSLAWAWLGEVTSLPLLPVSWAVQSFASRSFSARFDVGMIWTVATRTLVSAAWDVQRLPHPWFLCDPCSVPFFYVPPHGSWASRLAAASAACAISLSLKFFLFGVQVVLRAVLPYLPAVLEWAIFTFDMNWTYTPLGFLFLLVSVWFGFRGPPVPLINPWPPVWRTLKWLYAAYFGLPYARINRPAGYNLLYQFCAFYLILLLLWPKLSPITWVLARQLSRSPVVYVSFGSLAWWVSAAPWFSLCSVALTMWFSATYMCVRRRSGRLPHHDFAGEALSDANCHSADPPPTPPPMPPQKPLPPTPPVTPQPRRCVPAYMYEPDYAAPPPSTTPISLQDFEVHTPGPMPPPSPGPPRRPPVFVPADPYWLYRLVPAHFEDLFTWSLALARTPLPPGTLDVDRCCVWDCLATTLGLPADQLHACYLSTMSAADRLAYFDGLVPFDELSRVFGFFGVGATLRFAESGDPACPRAPGSRVLPRFDPRLPPALETRAAAWGLSATYYLARVPGGSYHLTANAQPGQQVATQAPLLGSMVGYVSRQLSRAELGALVNYPVKQFLLSWSRLAGLMPNVAALGAGLTSSGLPAAVAIPSLPVVEEVIDYAMTQRDYEYALGLSEDMKNNTDALELKDLDVVSVTRGIHEQARVAMKDYRAGLRARTVKLHMFAGIGGCGKTHAMLQAIAQRHAVAPFDCTNIRFHCWMRALRGPLRAAVEQVMPNLLQSYNFPTTCMPLVQPLPGVIVLDDATQLWPGFIPLLITRCPGLTDIYLTFDVTQGRTAFPKSDALSREYLSTAEWLAPLSTHYATEQWRLSGDNAALFGLPVPATRPGVLPMRGNVCFTSNVAPDIPLLVVSPRFATSQNEGGQRCMTFRECQGFTIEGDVTIDLGGLSATATDNAWWTALTRARGNICLFMGPLSQGPGINQPLYGRANIASALVAVTAQSACAVLDVTKDPLQIIARSVQAHIARSISPAAAARLGLPAASPVVGRSVDATSRYDWLERPRDSLGDFWTARSQRALNGPRYTGPAAFDRYSAKLINTEVADAPHMLRHFAAIPNDAVLHVPATDYKLPAHPKLTLAPDPALNFDHFVDAESREITAPNTNQTWQHVHDGPNAVLSHKRSDKMTAKISEAKRIHVGVDHAQLSTAECQRLRQLKKGFAKFFNVADWNEQAWDGQLFEQSTREAYASWVSKRSKKGIARSVAKNPLDAPCNMAHLFLKSQTVQKPTTRFSPARAGQTVTELSLTRQFRDAPFAKYVENMALRFCYDSTYLHCRASPADMNKWYERHWRQGIMTANDYTAWDSGCDRVFAAFDCWVLRLCGVPEEYIELYLFEKVNTFSHLGPHMCRQESGDRWTWLFNTLRNAALTGASLDMPAKTPAAFSGDDSVVLGEWRKPRGFASRMWAMVPKLEKGLRLLFCGYAFGGTSVALDDATVLHRAQNGLALGRNDPDFWRSVEDAICESGLTAPDYSASLSTANEIVVQAAIRYGFTNPRRLVLTRS